MESEYIHVYQKILDYREQGDLVSSFNLSLKIIKQDRFQPEWLYIQTINDLITLKKFSYGNFLCDTAISVHSQSDNIYRILGKFYQQITDKKNTFKNYQKALELNSNQPDWVYAYIVAILVESYNCQEAFIIGHQGLNLYPECYWIHYHLSIAYRYEEQWEQALFHLNQALAINPNLDIFNQTLQETIKEQKYFNESQLLYRQSLRQLYESQKDTPLYVLATYKDDPSGLGVVADQCHSLGEIIKDSRAIAGKILVAGRPDVYKQLVTFKNINYIWTTFESNLIPSSWVKAINERFTQVFVPHNYIKKVFLNSGVKPPIDIVPQSYVQYSRTKPINKKLNQLVLGTLGVPNERKNFDKLIKAVNHIHQEGYNIKLKIHCSFLLKNIQKQWADFPVIDLTIGSFSEQEIAEWYSNLDAYIYPSSGEGWSFTPRESMSLGIPTIITDIPLHQQLIDSKFYLPIHSDQWENAYFEFLNNTCGQWKFYSVQDIKNSIIQMIEEYDYWYLKAQEGRKWIQENTLSWSQIRQKLIKKIFYSK